jgi:hypothetical protein
MSEGERSKPIRITSDSGLFLRLPRNVQKGGGWLPDCPLRQTNGLHKLRQITDKAGVVHNLHLVRDSNPRRFFPRAPSRMRERLSSGVAITCPEAIKNCSAPSVLNWQLAVFKWLQVRRLRSSCCRTACESLTSSPSVGTISQYSATSSAKPPARP